MQCSNRTLLNEINTRLRYRLFRKSFTRGLVSRYCKGKGIEVGPGSAPYGKRSNTIYLDKYEYYQSKFLKLDIVADAATIPRPDDTFDFLISSHCLEHHPDALKVLIEWKRVVKPGGIFFLVLPHGSRTFDRGRKLTGLKHHIEDYQHKVTDDDHTHRKDFGDFSIQQLDHQWLKDATHSDGSYDFEYIVSQGHMHFHIWTQNEMIDVLRYIGLEVLLVIDELPDRRDSFLIISRLLTDGFD